MQSQLKTKGTKMKGTVKSVLSGDRLVLYGPKGKDGLPLEKTLQLVCCRAPRMGHSGERAHEPQALQTRDYLRRKLVGQVVEFYIEEKKDTLDIASVYYQGHELSSLLLSEGKVQFQNRRDSPNLAVYKECEVTAQDHKLGLWADKQPEGLMVEQLDDLESFVKAHKDQELAVVVEQVVSGNLLILHHGTTSFRAEMSELIFPKLESGPFAQLKSLVEQSLLQRDLKAVVKAVSANGKQIRVELTNEEAHKIKREVLIQGYARINMEAVLSKSKDNLQALKKAQEEGQNRQNGIWAGHTIQTQDNLGAGEFVGMVHEIHSGDSLTIQSLKDDSVQRYFLSNFRAPAMASHKDKQNNSSVQDKPYAFESKDALRKLLIGKKVSVHVDTTRTTKEKELQMKYVTVCVNHKCVQVTLCEMGLGQVQLPRQGDEYTKYLSEMKEAEEKAQKDKVGIFSAKQKPVHRFNDISQKKSKQFEQFVRDEGRIGGVVDYVLSGQRLKVRLNKHNSQVVMSLQGVRTLSNDANVALHQEYSNKAMLYTKSHLMQRDVEVEIDNCDNQGAFHGTIYLGGKDFNAMLIEEGLATASSKGTKFNEYLKIEKKAKEAKKGIWATEFNETGPRKEQNQPLGYSKRVTVTDVSDARQIYLQEIKSRIGEINKSIDSLNMSKQPRLEVPIKKGTPCLAQYSQDDEWYRAEYYMKDKKDYMVRFIDFGNVDRCQLEHLRKMPTGLNSIPPQAHSCQLAYLKAPSSNHEMSQEVTENLCELLLDQEMDANFVSQNGQYKMVELYLNDKKSPKDSVNAKLIAHGYAKLIPDQTLPAEWAFLEQEQDKAIAKKAGIWQYDDEDEEY